MRSAARFDDSDTVRRFYNGAESCWHVQIAQGESYVSGADNEVLTTVLGSCIAACLRDETARVGGMNHFLLPHGKGVDSSAMRYGVNAMELLINALFKRGAARERLEAKLFGGASVIAGLSDVGAGNAAFARRYLADEGIRVVGGDTGGIHPRRVQYWPLSGRARRLSIPPLERLSIAARERDAAADTKDTNDVELF